MPTEVGAAISKGELSVAMILTDKRAIVMKLRKPEVVLNVISTAKRFVVPATGEELVAIPHDPIPTMQLRILGFEGIPDPMNIYYTYPGRYKPFEAQRETASFASVHKRCFILNSMGLGKTITSLWAFDYLKSRKQVCKLMIVCPISVMERTWADEIMHNFPQYKVNILYGSAKKRIQLLEDRSADIYIVNTDGQKIIKDYMKDRWDINLIIIDEVALFRNSQSARWKSMNEICNKQIEGKRWVWGMTGSPIPNSPEDAYGQMKLVTPDSPRLPRSFSAWRDRVMLHVSQFKWAPKLDAVKTVFEVMQPSIRFSLDDAVDLPPQVIQERKVPMTTEQKRAFETMYSRLEMWAENEAKTITAVNDAVKVSKLLQIVCGVVYGEDGMEAVVNNKERLNALNEVVCESEGKVIVFVPFSAALENVRQYLEKQGHSVAVVQGSTSKAERDEIFYSFQNNEEPKVIVANPATMSHGLTLTAATTIAWYGPVYSNEIYQQACARVRRPGQKRATVIVHFTSSGLEDRIYQRLRDRQSVQGTLLEMVKEHKCTVVY